MVSSAFIIFMITFSRILSMTFIKVFKQVCWCSTPIRQTANSSNYLLQKQDRLFFATKVDVLSKCCNQQDSVQDIDENKSSVRRCGQLLAINVTLEFLNFA